MSERDVIEHCRELYYDHMVDDYYGSDEDYDDGDDYDDEDEIEEDEESGN